MSLEERLWGLVERRGPDQCWLWQGGTTPRGYGRFMVGSRSDGSRRLVYPHRLAYELVVGPIPEGFSIDHLCRTPSCVNPAHLEAVTPRVNVLRGVSPAASQARQVACLYGHAFDEANTYVDPRGRRNCRACRRARERRTAA